MHDPVRNPAHYAVYPVETILLAQELGFCMGNVVKYTLRAPWKNGVEDIDKALQFVGFERRSFQRGLPPTLYRMWLEDYAKLASFLCNADGDQLWSDIAFHTFEALECVKLYLASNNRGALDELEDSLRGLREVLQKASDPNGVYKGKCSKPYFPA